MKITNEQKLPYGLVRAVSPKKHNAPGCISATTLIQGVKQIILTERYWDELEDDVSNRVWAIFGTAVHSLLESEGENDFAEIEMKHKIGDITVTGKIDNYDIANGIICDYKTTSVYKIKAQEFADWYLQGMTYAWLLRKNNLRATKCRFIAMLKDFSKTEAARSSTYPQKPVFVYEFDVTEDRIQEIEKIIIRKIAEYKIWKDSADDEIPVCTPEERWARKDIYAVMKNGRKTAVKLFDDKQLADTYATELGKDHYVEYRQGESVRCKGYCLCSGYCNYCKENVNPKEIEKAA